MFDYLSEISTSIYNRYATVEGNIKTKSNSFYDAYLDLLETTLKVILDNGGIKYNVSKTCGFILRTNEVKDYLINTININEKLYEKLKDYTKKANDHKHKKEKNITVDSVVNFMKVYYDFSSCYGKYIGLKNIEEFDRYYFYRSFDVTGKENEIIKGDLEDIKVRLNDLEDKKEIPDSNRYIEKRNEAIDFRNFIVAAKSEYCWAGNDDDFKKQTGIIKLLSFILLGLEIISSTISTIALQIYSTFTLIGNIWAIFFLMLLIGILQAKRVVDDEKLSKISIEIFEQNQDGTFMPIYKEKRRYRWLRIARLIMVPLNVIGIFIIQTNLIYSVLVVLIEIIIFILILFVQYKVLEFYDDYFFIRYTGKLNGVNKVVYYNTLDGKIYSRNVAEKFLN